MDEKTITGVKEEVKRISQRNEIKLDEIIVFGSRTREDYREDSDVDILLVSQDFAGVNWYQRPQPFHLEWNYDKLPAPEILCYTPEEFETRRKKKPNIVRTAAKKGVKLA